MRNLWIVVLIALTCASCRNENPTEADGRAALDGILQSNFPKVAFEIKRFSKTNGISIPPAYELQYSATIEFPNGLAVPSAGFWGDLMAGGEMKSRLMMLSAKGFEIVEGESIRQRLVMQANSAILFVKSERGWTYSRD